MSIFGKIFGTGAGEILKPVSDILDNVITNKEEKIKAQAELEKVLNDYMIQKEQMANAAVEMYLKDTQDARQMNARVQESDKASWLSKNIAFMIDILLTIVWSAITVFLVARAMNLIAAKAIDLTAVLSIYTTVTAVFMTVVNFHRGTSRSSEKKNDIIKSISSTNNP